MTLQRRPADVPAARFLVHGKVQGVWFRAGARAQAERLGLAGFARNLPDGRVEVLASGAASALAALQQWLQQGPAQARVEGVSREPAADPAETGFRVE